MEKWVYYFSAKDREYKIEKARIEDYKYSNVKLMNRGYIINANQVFDTKEDCLNAYNKLNARAGVFINIKEN